ncbi:MAG TPA: PAS domain S-box protein, partial [Thermoanaerobaculia bacterium]|nr:PAS domain S-box protein [Thermoanaerobaculia bacterium]
MSCLSPLTFDHVPVPIAHVSLGGRILRVNAPFAEAAAMQPQDLINRPAESLFVPELAADEARTLRSVIKGDLGEAQFRKTLRRGDGTLVPHDIRYSAVRDLGGWAHCALIVLNGSDSGDGDRDRLAKVVSGLTGEAFFRALIVEMTAALGTDFGFIAELIPGSPKVSRVVAACDRGQIIPNFEYSLPGTPCEALAEYGVCSFPAGVHRLFPRDAALQELGMEAYVGIRLENSRKQPFGLMVTLHRAPLDNAEGVLALMRGFAPRVAAELERIQIEQELRRSERYLSEAQRIAHLGNWVWEPEEDRLLGSEEAYRICGLGGPPRAVPSAEFFRMIHPEDLERVRDAFATSIREIAPLEVECRIGPADGPWRIVELRGEIAFTLGSRVGRMRGTLQDVTDREQATEQLRKL